MVYAKIHYYVLEVAQLGKLVSMEISPKISKELGEFVERAADVVQYNMHNNHTVQYTPDDSHHTSQPARGFVPVMQIPLHFDYGQPEQLTGIWQQKILKERGVGAHASSDALQRESQAFTVLHEREDYKACDQQIQQAVDHAMHNIMEGNMMMYVPADEILRLQQDLMKHAQEFKQARASNPDMSIGHLTQQIGSGSQFATKYKNHFRQHHPKHPHTHEPGGRPAGDGSWVDHVSHSPHDAGHYHGAPL